MAGVLDARFSVVRAVVVVAVRCPQQAALLALGVGVVCATVPLAVLPHFEGQLIERAGHDPLDAGAVIRSAVFAVGLGALHIFVAMGVALGFRSLVLPLINSYETHMFSRVIRSPYAFFYRTGHR